MPTEVIMPQMGESIFEGTITRWLKKAGDTVQKDEPLFEISTDKVDAEIPSPVAGVLSEIRFPEGATVEINAVVAVIDGEAPVEADEAAPEVLQTLEKLATEGGGGFNPRKVPAESVGAFAPEELSSAQMSAGSTANRLRSSPLVRRIAKENNLDLRQIAGSGEERRRLAVLPADICAEDNSSGAKAPTDSAGTLRGLKPPPPSVASFSNVCKTSGAASSASTGASPSITATTVLTSTVAPSGNLDLRQHAGHGRGNLRVHLVGGDFKQRLVLFDAVAGLLEPLGDGALKDRLAHLGHDYVGWHGRSLRDAGPFVQADAANSRLCAASRIINCGTYGRSNGSVLALSRGSDGSGIRHSVAPPPPESAAACLPPETAERSQPRLGAQRLQALHRQHLLAEYLPELPRRLVGKGLQRWQLNWLRWIFHFQAGHRMIGNAARNNQAKIAQIGGHVEGKAVRRDAARHMNADGADLALRVLRRS